MTADAEAHASVQVASSFGGCLDELESFEAERGSSDAFAALLDELFDTVIPALERFPRVGTDILERAPASVQGHVIRDRVRDLLPSGGTVRQYAMKDHVILYLGQGTTVTLLAIRHHRQLGFDLDSYLAGE